MGLISLGRRRAGCRKTEVQFQGLPTAGAVLYVMTLFSPQRTCGLLKVKEARVLESRSNPGSEGGTALIQQRRAQEDSGVNLHQAN